MTARSRLVLLALTLVLLFVAVCAMPVTLDESGETVQALDKRTAHTGRGTWFYPGLGACGFTDGNNDPVVAISSQRWNNGENCNQWILITNTENGKIAYGRVRDECPGCGSGDLDMSPSLFEQIGALDTGVLSISWHFQPKEWSP